MIQYLLLHASYPYTREAGNLIIVYKNVQLDIGEVFPAVSRRGQEASIQQALELVPTNKFMWPSEQVIPHLLSSLELLDLARRSSQAGRESNMGW